MSRLQSLLVAAKAGRERWEPVPDVALPAIARQCGPEERREIDERLAALRAELAASDAADGDTQDEIHRTIVMFETLRRLAGESAMPGQGNESAWSLSPPSAVDPASASFPTSDSAPAPAMATSGLGWRTLRVIGWIMHAVVSLAVAFIALDLAHRGMAAVWPQYYAADPVTDADRWVVSAMTFGAGVVAAIALAIVAHRRRWWFLGLFLIAALAIDLMVVLGPWAAQPLWFKAGVVATVPLQLWLGGWVVSRVTRLARAG